LKCSITQFRIRFRSRLILIWPFIETKQAAGLVLTWRIFSSMRTMPPWREKQWNKVLTWHGFEWSSVCNWCFSLHSFSCFPPAICDMSCACLAGCSLGGVTECHILIGTLDKSRDFHKRIDKINSNPINLSDLSELEFDPNLFFFIKSNWYEPHPI
jgi:hypothetical protein